MPIELDILKSSALLCRTGAIDSVFHRLIALRDNYKSDVNDSCFLSHTLAISRCIREINGIFLTKFMREYKLINWACGLCQILDTSNKDVCELLPFLLTSYIYNFPDNQFVSCFLSQNSLCSREDTRLYATNKKSLDKLIFPDKSLVGMGRLLMGSMTGNNREAQELTRLANRFLLPDIKPIRLHDGSHVEDDRFTPPKRHRSKIANSIQRVKVGTPLRTAYIADIDDDSNLLEIPLTDNVIEIPPGGHIIYEKQFVLSLFARISFITISIHDKHPNCFFCPPDLLKSWILLLDGLQDTVELSMLCENLTADAYGDTNDQMNRLLKEIANRNSNKYTFVFINE